MQTNKISDTDGFNELKYNFNELPMKLIISLKQNLRNIKSILQLEHCDRLKLVDGQEFKIMKDLTSLLLAILTCNENSDDSVSDKDMKENKTLYLKARVKFVGTTDLITVQHIIRTDMDPSALHR